MSQIGIIEFRPIGWEIMEPLYNIASPYLYEEGELE